MTHDERMHELLYSNEGRVEQCERIVALEELVRAAWKCIHTGLSCSDCRLIAGGCTLQSAMQELEVEL